MNSKHRTIKSTQGKRDIDTNKIKESRDLRKDKKQNIQVFVRVRPTNDIERAGKSVTVVDVVPDKQLIVRERPRDKLTKKFTFDKVFGPLSKQIKVYNAVVSPMLDEVLAGYNCTVLAYGQTGTGKTFTMEGVNNDPSIDWETDSSTGIIPRALSHIFAKLNTLDVQEYAVRVSYLQLYNEEISDLLSSKDDCSKIRIYEGSTKKGAVIVHGVEEVAVHNKSEVYNILHKGSAKRQMAATLMNAHSSRSHTIFSITVHIKEKSIDGEEFLKTGKLNLVDLAGSENIGRSGSIDRRAREAGNINQSLLTLGRVITALMERTPHIPYRESKLTRLLQDSLGGRAKTSIIATVSPASINLKESLSTLDYAHRAKNITNRPEINQKLSKKALLREYAEELERLRRDLLASRERNGVYLAVDNYNEMQALLAFQEKEIEEKVNHIKALQEAMNNKEQIFNDLQSKHCAQADELFKTKNQLQTSVDVVKTTAARLVVTKQEREEQKHLLEKHVSTENVLLSQAQEVLNVSDMARTDVNILHEKVYRKNHVEQQNTYLVQQFKSNTAEQIRDIENNICAHAKELIEFCTLMKNQIGIQSGPHCKSTDETIRNISEELVNSERNATDELQKNINNSYWRYQWWLETEIKNATTTTERECLNLTDISSKLVPKIQQLIENNIAENVCALNADVSRRLAILATCTKTSITSICNYGIKQRDSLFNDIEAVKANVEDLHQNSNKITEKRENFAKTMEELQLRFHNLRKEQQESDSAKTTRLSRISEMCSNICNRVSHTCNENIEQQRSFERRLENDLEIIKADVASEADNCGKLAEDAVVQSKTLLNKLQLDLGRNCESLTDYKNCLEQSVNLIQKKLESDQRIILASINDTCAMVYNTGSEHAKCLETGKTTLSNASAKILSKFESENANAETMISTITAQLKTMRDQVEKFVFKDLQHDVSTGLTPAKKYFRYPKQLTVTSPHEQILIRFRETSTNIDTVEEETNNSLS